MTEIVIVLLVLVIRGLAVAIFLLFNRRLGKQPESLMMLQQQLNHITQVLDNKLSESTKTIQTQFGQSAKIIQDVTEKLTRLDETNRQVVSFADQLRSLQDILKNPKQRGILGEYYLETVLKNVLPPGSYQTQYSFKDGRIDETSKYVKPEENTMDFAFMFIPSEAVYYDLLINKVGAVTGDTNNLIYYAGQKKVIIVSPTSFLAYLQTVLQGLKNQKISEQAMEIIKQVERLGKHLGGYSEYMDKLGNHLGTTVSSYNKASKELAKVDKDVVKITGKETKIKLPEEEIETPLLEE